MDELTPKQRLFVEEYLKDANGTQAAIRAGYSEKTANEQASQLLTKLSISEAIQTAMDKRSARTEITADYVLSTIKKTIERCLQAEPVWEWDNDAKDMVKTGEWQFKENAVLKGCELLGRHLKLFTDKVEHTGKVTWESILNQVDEKQKEQIDAVKETAQLNKNC